MRSRYRKTIAGFLWVVLNPIIMYSVQSFVFRKFLKLEVPNYSLFLLCGLLPWIFIVMTADMVTPILDFSGELLKSFKMSPAVLVYAQVLDNFINFIFAFFLILIPTWIFSDQTFSGVIFLPVALALLVAGVSSACWLLSVMQVFFKDIRFIVSFLTSILFFLTPVFYPVEFVPEKYRIFVDFNPIYAMIEPFRYCIYNYNLELLCKSLLRSFVVCCMIFTLAVGFWKRKKNEFYLSL